MSKFMIMIKSSKTGNASGSYRDRARDGVRGDRVDRRES